jgi:UDP-GlcNAc3NAcA epimerase
MTKIVTVLGARPQFIKASVVSRALNAVRDGLSEVVVHTGQHYDANMSDVFFEELDMARPAHELRIHGGTHGEMTGRMLADVERVLLAERPDAVLVYGDTNSTLAGALAAAKLQIPVAHVEAGLRSFNLAMPEEINRIVTDRLARWLFTPTDAASLNLRQEGVAPDRVLQVGDVMYDVALRNAGRVAGRRALLERLGLHPGRFVLATIHRAENTEEPRRLEAIVDALVVVARQLRVIWPVHPRTREVLRRLGLLERLSAAVDVVEPVCYLDMVQLEMNAALIATDSGGVQKEAFFYRVPCVTLRDETEWVELVAAGWNRLAAPVSAEAIAETILAAIGTHGVDVQPYGAGDSAVRIVDLLRSELGG